MDVDREPFGLILVFCAPFALRSGTYYVGPPRSSSFVQVLFTYLVHTHAMHATIQRPRPC